MSIIIFACPIKCSHLWWDNVHCKAYKRKMINHCKICQRIYCLLSHLHNAPGSNPQTELNNSFGYMHFWRGKWLCTMLYYKCKWQICTFKEGNYVWSNLTINVGLLIPCICSSIISESAAIWSKVLVLDIIAMLELRNNLLWTKWAFFNVLNLLTECEDGSHINTTIKGWFRFINTSWEQ